MSDLTPETKAQIDAMSYEDMLRLWRFAPVGDPFAGETGTAADYFVKRMSELRTQGADHLGASKKIGWAP